MTTKALTITDLFNECIEYPRIMELDEILKPGDLYNYVSSTFLNGFINSCGTIVSALLIHRYVAWDAKCSADFSYQDPPNSRKWVHAGADESMTKREVFDLVTQPGRLFHTDLSVFRDDVLVLSRTGRDNEYMFFWFDCDVSDCCIGRFRSDLPQEQIIEAMAEAGRIASSRQLGEPVDPTPIPLHALQGWIKF